MADELFSKSEVVIPQNTRRRLTDKQFLAINRDKVIKSFCRKWQEKYNLSYVMPPRSFMSVEKPISDALAQNYTVEMMEKGIDSYLSNDFKGYAEQSHPIKFFTGNITKWVSQSQRENTQRAKSSEVDEVRELNLKYGILKKGDLWVDENGKVYISKEDAIRAVGGNIDVNKKL